MATGPDRSLTGISLPQWMKAKSADRYDLDSSAFSPPNDDDGFFLIRYRNTKSADPEPKVVTPNTSKYTPISQVLDNKESQFKAPSQHTAPCQDFIPQAKITPRDIGMKHGIEPPLGKIKSTGTDDGFKGEGAACGYSVVAVAHQMIAEKGSDELSCPKPQRVRRNSKSLPASPQTSPKLLRKNPYFTSILFGSTDTVDSDNNNSSLQSYRGILRGSVEDFVGPKSSQNRMGRVLSDGDTPISERPGPAGPPPQSSRTYRAKPSELREMNFWSPTSM